MHAVPASAVAHARTKSLVELRSWVSEGLDPGTRAALGIQIHTGGPERQEQLKDERAGGNPKPSTRVASDRQQDWTSTRD